MVYEDEQETERCAKRQKFRDEWVPYCGEPLRTGGFQLSPTEQSAIVKCMDAVYDGRFSKEFNIVISPAEQQRIDEDKTLYEADTYGELSHLCLLDMLWRVGAQPGSRFYDLGCGPGKLPSLAWMAGLHAIGIEFSHPRWEGSCCAIGGLKEMAEQKDLFQREGMLGKESNSLATVCGSMLDLDFTDADILFFNSVAFSDDMVRVIVATSRWMRPGTIIVSYHRFEGPEFKHLGSMVQPTSWDYQLVWHVHEVLQNPSGEKPTGLKHFNEFGEGTLCSFAEPIKMDKDISDIYYESFKRWREKMEAASADISKRMKH